MSVASDPLPRDLPSLTSLRAIAALLVFVFHLGRWDALTLPFFQLGDTGVSFFFVLSGFLLTWGYKAGSRRLFYWRRIARIYPSHVVVWLGVMLFPLAFADFDAEDAVLNLLLLQAWVPSRAFELNGVTWSLSCEVAFYAAFPLLLGCIRNVGHRALWSIAVTSFVVAGIFVVAVSGEGVPESLSVVGYVNPVVRFPEFLLGIAAGRAVMSGWAPSWRLLLGVAVPGLVGLGIFPDRPARDVWMAPLFVLVIALCARRDVNGRSKWLASPVFVYAGKLSFAFYLVHELVIVNVLESSTNAAVIVLASLAISIAAAAILHHGVEVPAQRWLVRRLRVTRLTPPSDPVQS